MKTCFSVYIMAWLLAPGLAMGHARFVGGVPGPGEVLDSAPASLVLEFSKPVQPVSVQILNAGGVDVAAGAMPRAVDTRVELELASALASGRYTVSYRVLSGDAHPLVASYEFSVQGVAEDVTPTAPPIAVATDDVARAQAPDWGITTIVTRAAYMLGFLLTVGGGLFLLLVPVSGLQALWQRATMGFALYTLLAALTYLQVSGANMLGAAGLPNMAALKVAAGSSLGSSLGIALLGLLGVLVARARPGALLIISLLLLVCSRLVTGHPAVREPAWLLVPAMAVHVTAAAFWYGSLAPLFFGLGRLRADEAAGMVTRFGQVAMVGVALLATPVF